MAGEIISESVGGIIPERRAASSGIGRRGILENRHLVEQEFVVQL
jgi:hypothetical protein